MLTIGLKDLRNTDLLVCFGIDSVPEMTSQIDYTQVSLDVVFDVTGSKIARFFIRQKRGEGKSISKTVFLQYISRCHLDLVRQIKKSVVYT